MRRCLYYYMIIFIILSCVVTCNAQVGQVVKPEVVVQTGHNGFITNLKFIDNGNYLISSGSDGEIKIWDVKSRLLIKTINASSNIITALEINNKDSILFCGGLDKIITFSKIFDNNKYPDKITKTSDKLFEGNIQQIIALDSDDYLIGIGSYNNKVFKYYIYFMNVKNETFDQLPININSSYYRMFLGMDKYLYIFYKNRLEIYDMDEIKKFKFQSNLKELFDAFNDDLGNSLCDEKPISYEIFTWTEKANIALLESNIEQSELIYEYKRDKSKDQYFDSLFYSNFPEPLLSKAINVNFANNFYHFSDRIYFSSLDTLVVFNESNNSLNFIKMEKPIKQVCGNDNYIVVAYDNSINIMNTRDLQPKQKYFINDTLTVLTIDNNIIASGFTNGNITLFDTENNNKYILSNNNFSTYSDIFLDNRKLTMINKNNIRRIFHLDSFKIDNDNDNHEWDKSDFIFDRDKKYYAYRNTEDIFIRDYETNDIICKVDNFKYNLNIFESIPEMNLFAFISNDTNYAHLYLYNCSNKQFQEIQLKNKSKILSFQILSKYNTLIIVYHADSSLYFSDFKETIFDKMELNDIANFEFSQDNKYLLLYGEFSVGGFNYHRFSDWVNICNKGPLDLYNDGQSLQQLFAYRKCFLTDDNRYIGMYTDNCNIYTFYNTASCKKINTLFHGIEYCTSYNFSSAGYPVLGLKDGILRIFEDDINYFEHNYPLSDIVDIYIGEYGKLSLLDINGNILIEDLINQMYTLIKITNSNHYFITSNSYYTCTKNGDNAIAFRIGNRAYPFEQFDLRLNRPDIVLERLGYAEPKTIENMKKAYYLRLKKMGFTQKQLDTTFHLPEIELNEKDWNFTTDKRMIKINVTVKDSVYQLRQLNVYNNNVPIYGTKGINLVGKNKETKTEFGNKQYYYNTTLTIPLVKGENKLQFSVLNEGGTESLYETRYITCTDSSYNPHLYIVAIGISDYPPEAGLDSLKFADNDADSIIKIFSSQSSYDKKNIHIIELKNSEATLENIVNVKKILMQTDPEDEVIVHFSGHGILDDSCQFRFANYDIVKENSIETGLAYDAIDNLVDGIPALKKVILIDACHSGEDITDADLAYLKEDIKSDKKGYASAGYCYASAKNIVELQEQLFSDLRRGSGAIVISAARGSQSSYEPKYDEYQNGVFTHLVIEGLREISSENDSVKISELMDYVLDKIKDSKYKDIQTPTFRRENLENDYIIFTK